MSHQVVLDDQQTPHVVRATASAPLSGGQVRVRVSFAGVNFWEVMQRRGRVPLADPRVPGTEGVGVVEEVGSLVSGLTTGTRVAWSRVPGSWAESLVAPADALFAVPEGVADEVAASLLFQGQTAYYLCHETWPLGPGDSAVVTSAAGGVGQLLTQLLVGRGARVIAVVSSEPKVESARASGAYEVLRYGTGLADQVRVLVPDGVAAVFDAVGAGVAEPLLRTLRPRGAMVLYGSSSGNEAAISASHLGAGSYYLTRTAGRDYLGDADQSRARADRLFELVLDGTLHPTVGATYRLDEAERALNDLESRTSIGKLLLQP